MPHCTGKEMNTEGAKAAPACSVEDLLVLDVPELSMLPPAALEIWGEHPQAPLYLYPRVGTPPRGEEKLWPAWSYQTPAPKTPPTTPPRLHRDPAHWRRDQLRRKGRAYQQAHPQGPPGAIPPFPCGLIDPGPPALAAGPPQGPPGAIPPFPCGLIDPGPPALAAGPPPWALFGEEMASPWEAFGPRGGGAGFPPPPEVSAADFAALLNSLGAAEAGARAPNASPERPR
jgi:hypothetical protein